MTFVTAISKAHSQGVAICLKEWGGYWYFANDGYLRNADNTLVENYRIAMYATREDWQIVHVKNKRRITMTQEEKFEEAKRLYESANADQRYVLESLFPELKELENERIKSAAIEFVIQNKSFNYYLGISKDNVVTWINRQGEQKAWTEEDKNMLKWVIGYLENKMLNTPISEERTACKNAIAWLEEKLKGEQKPNPCDGCVNRKGCINCENGELRETEQKPADEVEPKFKVGDIIKHNKVNAICKVISVNSGSYYIDNIETNGRIKLFNAEQNFHLWTIQDAKDGDVLVCESGWTCIFKKLNHNSFGEILFDSYCFIDRTGWFCDGAKGHTLNERINGKIYPATKEQSDLLFAKMKEAGYEWDAKKKELKKIEQEPTTWNEEDKAHIDSLLKRLEGMCKPDATFISTEFAISEDEDWLKSLRHRLQWKPSDEQIKALEESIMFLGTSWVSTRQLALESLYQDLKKLKGEQL